MTLTYRLWGIAWIVLKSVFSWQCQNLCWLSSAFIIDWRVVYSLICLIIVTSSTIDIFFEITKFSKILSKLTLFSKILSKFDKIFENFRKKCQFRKYFRKFCNYEKSAMVNEVNIKHTCVLFISEWHPLKINNFILQKGTFSAQEVAKLWLSKWVKIRDK